MSTKLYYAVVKEGMENSVSVQVMGPFVTVRPLGRLETFYRWLTVDGSSVVE